MNKDLDFNTPVLGKDIQNDLNISIAYLDCKERLKGQFRNLVHDGSLNIHEDKYALNIKVYNWINPNLSGLDLEDSIGHVCAIFFYAAEVTAKEFGFAGMTTGGRSGGWLYLTNYHHGTFKEVQANDVEFVDFKEHIRQEKVWMYFTLIKQLKNDLMEIFRTGTDYEDIVEKTESYIYG